MTRYVMLLAYEAASWEDATPEVQQRYFTAHQAFEDFVDAHGTRHSSAALAGTDTATTVRHRDGAWDAPAEPTDGPFVETTEIVGGYYDVELPDLDHAIEAASLLPATYAVEIRPTVTVG